MPVSTAPAKPAKAKGGRKGAKAAAADAADDGDVADGGGGGGGAVAAAAKSPRRKKGPKAARAAAAQSAAAAAMADGPEVVDLTDGDGETEGAAPAPPAHGAGAGAAVSPSRSKAKSILLQPRARPSGGALQPPPAKRQARRDSGVGAGRGGAASKGGANKGRRSGGLEVRDVEPLSIEDASPEDERAREAAEEQARDDDDDEVFEEVRLLPLASVASVVLGRPRCTTAASRNATAAPPPAPPQGSLEYETAQQAIKDMRAWIAEMKGVNAQTIFKPQASGVALGAAGRTSRAELRDRRACEPHARAGGVLAGREAAAHGQGAGGRGRHAAAAEAAVRPAHPAGERVRAPAGSCGTGIAKDCDRPSACARGLRLARRVRAGVREGVGVRAARAARRRARGLHLRPRRVHGLAGHAPRGRCVHTARASAQR